MSFNIAIKLGQKRGGERTLPDEENTQQDLRLSKLEVCLETLKTLASTGPLSLTKAHKLTANGRSLEEFTGDIDFLDQQGAISRMEDAKGQTFCSITPRGTKVLCYFKLLPKRFLVENLESLEREASTR